MTGLVERPGSPILGPGVGPPPWETSEQAEENDGAPLGWYGRPGTLGGSGNCAVAAAWPGT